MHQLYKLYFILQVVVYARSGKIGSEGFQLLLPILLQGSSSHMNVFGDGGKAVDARSQLSGYGV